MRVLFWSELFWPYVGGAEVFSAELITALQEHGYEVIVVTAHDYLDLPDETQYKGIPIYRFPFRNALTGGGIDQFLEARRQVARLKQTFNPDLIHINAVSPSVLFHLQTANAHPAPVLVRMNQEIFSSEGARPDTLMRKVLRAADWIACVSAAVLAQVRQWVPEMSPRSSVIYNGLDAPLPPPEPLFTNRPRLLCLGRLVPAKGFDLALTALATILDRFPHVRLIVAGGGPERPGLEQQVAHLGLTDFVNFIGWIVPDEVPHVMREATIVVMPSRREGLPRVALEAALMARPVVATRVGGLPEIIRHQQTGWLVEPEDSEGLAEAISFLLEHPEVAAQMGQAARRRAQKVFSFERCVNAYDALYRKLALTTST